MAITDKDLIDLNIDNEKPVKVQPCNVVFIRAGEGVIPYFQPGDDSLKFYPHGIPGQIITDLEQLREFLILLNVL